MGGYYLPDRLQNLLDRMAAREEQARTCPPRTRRAPEGIYAGEGMPSLGTPGLKKYKATGEWRAPKRGEFYLSGAIITAYRAPNDFSEDDRFWIAAEVRIIPPVPVPVRWEWVK